MTEITPQPKTNPAAILTLISLPVFIGALDLTIVSAVLPAVIVDLKIPFQTGADDAAWIVAGYLLAYTISVALMGRVSDLIGRRRTYFLALLIFIFGSWWVAAATGVPTLWVRRVVIFFSGSRPDQAYMALYALIVGRVIQALGAGAMVPVSMALVADLFPEGKRAVPLGIIGGVDTAGWVLGSLYGGLMVQVVPWPVLFWLNIPITAIVAFITWRQLAPIAERNNEGGLNRIAWVAVGVGVGLTTLLALTEIGATFLPALESLGASLLKLKWLAWLIVGALLVAVLAPILGREGVRSQRRFDWAGAGLLSLALFGLNVGLGGGAEPARDVALGGLESPLPPYALALLGLALLAFIAFLLVEQRVAHPLFDLTTFRDRQIGVANGINLLVGFCLMVGLVSVPLFVNAVIATDLDQGALVSGVLLGALTVPMALASIPGGLWTTRSGYRWPTLAGMALAALGFFIARTWTPYVTQVTMASHMVLAGIGLGLTIAPISATVVDSVGGEEHGVAAAMVLVMRLVGMTIGTSVMTSYGLRRSTLLLEQGAASLGENVDFAEFARLAVQSTVTVINEMMVIAAVVALVGVGLAWLLRSRVNAVQQYD